MVDLKRKIAEHSLEWRDEDKISFLWGDLVVLAYIREDYKVWYALTDLPTQEAIEINAWLGKHLQTLEAEKEEDEQALREKLAVEARDRKKSGRVVPNPLRDLPL